MFSGAELQAVHGKSQASVSGHASSSGQASSGQASTGQALVSSQASPVSGQATTSGQVSVATTKAKKSKRGKASDADKEETFVW